MRSPACQRAHLALTPTRRGGLGRVLVAPEIAHAKPDDTIKDGNRHDEIRFINELVNVAATETE